MFTRKKAWFLRILIFLMSFFALLIGLTAGLVENKIPDMIDSLIISLAIWLASVSTFPVFIIDDCFKRILSKISEKSDFQQDSITIPSKKKCFKIKMALVLFIVGGSAPIFISLILRELYNNTLIMIIWMFVANAIFLISYSISLSLRINSCFAQLEEIISGLEMKQIK